MNKSEMPMDVSSDVLHIPAESKLSPEEIAKAIAHHKRHHQEEQPPAAKTAQKPGSKKQK